MLLSKIIYEPENSLAYMERNVNNGSPSNFTFKNTTSKITNPLFVESYNIYIAYDYRCMFKAIGNVPNFKNIIIPENMDYVFIHPDLQCFNFTNTKELSFTVQPTSSFRTVRIKSSPYYLKLAYPKVLGRITREIEHKNIYSSLEVNNILSDLVCKYDAPGQLSFLPEKSGKIYNFKDKEYGYIIRDVIPLGKNSNKILSLIPAFSLYSKDRLNDDFPIIVQLINNKKNKLDFLLNQLIFPVIDSYFYCVFSGGLQPEMHSQNFLIGLDNELNICSIVLRDLESVDKDLTIMEQIGIETEFTSYPFKCIEKGQYNYYIKHSFMFDHKLCEYFFDPLIRCLSEFNYFEEKDITKEIKNYVNSKYKNELLHFFPSDGKWYKFENVVIDRTKTYRPYMTIDNPKYR